MSRESLKIINNKRGKIMKKYKLIMLVMVTLMTLSACTEMSQQSSVTEQVQNEKNARTVIDNSPTPKMERSLERENLIRRAKFINQPNRVGYLYLLTDNGQLVREEQVQGKVSSLNSYLTPMEELVKVTSVSDRYLMSAPDIDGTWGENSSGIFWFTPEGVYREWTGRYFFSSERLDFETKPILTQKEK